MSALSLATIAAGVRGGAASAFQVSERKPLHAGLADGRHLGHRVDALRRRHRQHLRLLRLVLRAHRVDLEEQQVDVAGDEIVHGLRGAAIGHVRELRAGDAREQFAGEMRRGADALRAEIDLARIGLGIGDQLGHGVRRKFRPHHQRVRDRGHDRQRLERGRIEVELLVNDHVGRQRRRLRRQQRVAVGLGLGHRLGAEIAAGAGPVLHHERLAPHLRQPVGDHAGDDVDAAAGRSGDDDLDRAVGIARLGLGEGWRGHGERCRCRNQAKNLPRNFSIARPRGLTKREPSGYSAADRFVLPRAE